MSCDLQTIRHRRGDKGGTETRITGNVGMFIVSERIDYRLFRARETLGDKHKLCRYGSDFPVRIFSANLDTGNMAIGIAFETHGIGRPQTGVFPLDFERFALTVAHRA